MPQNTPRRNFLKTGLAAAAASSLPLASRADAVTSREGTVRNAIPRWRGFNLMPFFSALAGNEQYSGQTVRSEDLQWMGEWGFDYVRLPFDYWIFVDGSWHQTRRMDPADISQIDNAALERLDRAIEHVIGAGMHLTLNMHRAPGYCINGWDREPFNLWKDAAAEDAFALFWDLLAKRYQGYSRDQLSFNLVNEAPSVSDKMSPEDYRRVMVRGQRIIHAISPDRIVIIDGTGVGREVVENMLHEPVAQAFHAYDPFRLTHYKASWVGQNADWPKPQWPYPNPDGSIFDRQTLALRFAPWVELVRQGVGVHCGEFGSYNHTPHKVFLEWMEAVLTLLRDNDIGYALWNFRGNFGILDSGRSDVKYEDWHGHKLDRELLSLLRKY